MKLNKLSILGALALTAGASSTAVAQTPNTKVFDGSDTLITIMEELKTLCNLSDANTAPGTYNYLGNGSGDGEAALCAGTQDLAPMSRTLKSSKVCAGGSCAANATDPCGIAVAGDSIAIVRSNGGTDDNCNNDIANVAVDKLKLIYGGTDGSGSKAACEAAERVNFVNDWNAMYADSCTSTECNQLHRAFRRGDTSGTTSVFKKRTGITNFCNGKQNEDNDPIRRPCRADEELCQADGTLGLVLPIFINEGDSDSPVRINY